uniref:Uncharacterized protein n=1 Tax=Caenorhabditis japonica TaxID=281687 RepID=A0A8R1IPR8_CAEJA
MFMEKRIRLSSSFRKSVCRQCNAQLMTTEGGKAKHYKGRPDSILISGAQRKEYRASIFGDSTINWSGGKGLNQSRRLRLTV